jgi:hypothetical protein
MEKTITINPEDFKIKNNKPKSRSSRNNRDNRNKKLSSKAREKKLKSLKENLLKKIKQHQERHKIQLNEKEKPQPKGTHKVKPSSFEYLENLQKEYDKSQKTKIDTKPPKKLQKNIDKIFKTPQIEKSPNHKSQILNKDDKPIKSVKPNIQINQQPNIEIKQQPVYGILKGGKKPLYSNYRKTLKQQQKLKTLQERSPRHKTMTNHKPLNINERIQDSIIINPIDRNEKLKKVKQLFNAKNSNTQKTKSILKPKLKSEPKLSQTIKKNNGNTGNRVRRTIRRKYQVGKTMKNNSNQVHVLVKNRKTSKKNAMEYKGLKRVPLIDVKKYLRERNLIRVGSQAPEYILRELYESSKISGNVENKSSDVLYHNFINTDGETDGDLQPIYTSMNYDAVDLLKQLGNNFQDNTAPGDTSALDVMLTSKH